ELAQAERKGCKPYSNFTLGAAAQVRKASLTGMRVLHRLGYRLPIWPIDPLPAPASLLVELYTALAATDAARTAAQSKLRSFDGLIRAPAPSGSAPVPRAGPLGDHGADALLTAAWPRLVANRRDLWHPQGLTPELAQTEG